MDSDKLPFLLMPKITPVTTEYITEETEVWKIPPLDYAKIPLYEPEPEIIERFELWAVFGTIPANFINRDHVFRPKDDKVNWQKEGF